MDSRITDLPFSRQFMKLILDQDAIQPTILSIKAIDMALGRSLEHLQRYVAARDGVEMGEAVLVDDVPIEELALDFVLPGAPHIELKTGGKDIAVNLRNVHEYIRLVIEFTLDRAVSAQARAFREGFATVFPVRDLRTFTPDELVILFGNMEEDWSSESASRALETYHILIDLHTALAEHLRADHGFNPESRAIRNLIAIMSSKLASRGRAAVRNL